MKRDILNLFQVRDPCLGARGPANALNQKQPQCVVARPEFDGFAAWQKDDRSFTHIDGKRLTMRDAASA
jgi:hypothetical protein